MSANGVFVDDEDKQYAALLSTPGHLVFAHQTVIPITEQALAVKSVDPTVVALDYRLDEVTPGIDAAHTYKGSALAQLLRDAAISEPERDFAIILVSNEMKLKALYSPDKTAHDLFDLVYTKEEVTDERSRIQTEVLSLSNGYLRLRELNRAYDPVVVLAADESERELVSIQEIATAFQHAAAPHIASKIILRNFIERAGLLIDDDDAAALLGLDSKSFANVTKILVASAIDYRGIYSDGWQRWWKHRLEEWGVSQLDNSLLSLTAAERAVALSHCTGRDLKPAASPWNDSTDEYIGFACVSCRRPTELRHSLAAFDPKAPRYAIRPRICWDCIQTDRYVEESHLVDESDEELIADIKKRDRKA